MVHIRRWICYSLGRPVPSQYVENPLPSTFSEGYLLLQFIEPTRGQPLFQTWSTGRKDAAKRQNLFQGISRLMLGLAQAPLSRIGSFTFHNDGTISLANRPLTAEVAILENDGAKQVMSLDETYEHVGSYVADLLDLHDNRFSAQPNAIKDEADRYYQMTIQMLLRSMASNHLDRSLQRGPFRMQFTDIHPGNLIVDDDWNITTLIDLEWICSRPPQMIDVPYWITSKSIDEVCSSEHLEEYTKAKEDFMAQFEKEERKASIEGLGSSSASLTEIIRCTFSSRATWFFHALDSVNAMYLIFEHQLRPQFMASAIPDVVDKYFARFWRPDIVKIVQGKLREREEYEASLQTLFGVESDTLGESGFEQ